MFFVCMNQAISDARYRVRIADFDFRLGCDRVTSGAQMLVISATLMATALSSLWISLSLKKQKQFI